MAQGHGLDGGRLEGMGSGRYGGQRSRRVPEACPGPRPGSRGEAGAQLLLGPGDAVGKAAAIPGELLPGTPAGSLGWSRPDDQEMDGDFLREAHLETDRHRRQDRETQDTHGHRRGERGRREREIENQTKISYTKMLAIWLVTCLPPDPPSDSLRWRWSPWG